MGVLSWRGLVTPQICSASSGETLHQTPKSLWGARTCSRSSITMPSLVGFGFHHPAKNIEFFVCLSVRHAFERQTLCTWFRHEGVGLQKQFWYRWIGEDLWWWPLFNFLRLLPTGNTIRCRSSKISKNWGFFAATGWQNKAIETKFSR